MRQVDLPDDFDDEIANTQEQMQEALFCYKEICCQNRMEQGLMIAQTFELVQVEVGKAERQDDSHNQSVL